jgi:hypothetical protein
VTVPLDDAWLAERFGRAYIDYCARVPPLPRVGLTTFAAVWSAMGSLGSLSWTALARRLPATVVTLALAVVAEISEWLPHLFR